eukprot:508482-Pyramimonas_sp.AAC.2
MKTRRLTTPGNNCLSSDGRHASNAFNSSSRVYLPCLQQAGQFSVVAPTEHVAISLREPGKEHP